MQQYLVITAQCTDQPSTISEFSKIFSANGCSIIQSRMVTFGQEFAIMMLLNGSWDAIAKMESALHAAEKRFDMTITAKRTSPREHAEDLLPYSVQVICLDNPGVIQKITEFFNGQNILIDELTSDTYITCNTKTTMLTLTLTINIPANSHIASIRERFLLFCDDYNLDAIIEPVKG